MRHRPSRSPVEQLRAAIDCLPVRTRVAMLEGIHANDIIAGAYSSRDGGVCPMLAAHRHGGRTSFLGFARAWDRFARADRARRASERELRVLVTQLEASLAAEAAATGADGAEPVDGALARAIADHRALAERRRREAAVEWGPPERGDARVPAPAPDASLDVMPVAAARRLRRGWLGVFRRYDEYARALARVERVAGGEVDEVMATAIRPRAERPARERAGAR